MSKSLRRIAAILAVTMSAAAASVIVAPSAMAISSDYCGYGRVDGEPFCFEGSGYRGWRYHQASTGSQGPLINICVRAYGAHGAYRVRTCSGTPSNFISRQYCNANPLTNSSVGWFGSGKVKLYGHADSRTCTLRRSGELPAYVADAFSDPGAGGQASVSPTTARAVASAGNGDIFTLSGATQRCVVAVTDDGFGGTCTTATQLKADGGLQLVSEQIANGSYRVFGLLGDDAVAAEIRTADGQDHQVAISAARAGLAVLKRKPTSITMTSASGRKTTPLR